jgi:hypothetical protein
MGSSYYFDHLSSAELAAGHTLERLLNVYYKNPLETAMPQKQFDQIYMEMIILAQQVLLGDR